MISWFDLWNRIASTICSMRYFYIFRAIRRLRNNVVVGEIRRQRYCVNHERNIFYLYSSMWHVML